VLEADGQAVLKQALAWVESRMSEA
jgi:hypothetical protein